jgi:hypothetical protein
MLDGADNFCIMPTPESIDLHSEVMDMHKSDQQRYGQPAGDRNPSASVPKADSASVSKTGSRNAVRYEWY